MTDPRANSPQPGAGNNILTSDSNHLQQDRGNRRRRTRRVGSIGLAKVGPRKKAYRQAATCGGGSEKRLSCSEGTKALATIRLGRCNVGSFARHAIAAVSGLAARATTSGRTATA